MLVLIGPTAVGKTEALLKHLVGTAEVVSADSLQAYRGLDIGSAKPGSDTLAKLPHHLLDILSPSEQYNVGEFVHAADVLVEDISKRGKLPVVSGGTAFYIRGFLYGLPGTPPADLKVREMIERETHSIPSDSLHAELEKVDPPAAVKISPTDRYRIIRAMEVIRLTGRPLSSYVVPNTYRSRFEFQVIGLELPRLELYEKIEDRVERMFQEGFVEEVDELRRRGFGSGDPGMQGIGYKELCTTLTEGGDPLEAKELIKSNTKKYAKRQMTFFKRFDPVTWMSPDDGERFSETIANIL